MPFDDRPMDLPRLDVSGLRTELADLNRLADGFGRAMTRALDGGIVRGRSFGDVLRRLALDLSNVALRAASSGRLAASRLAS